MWTCPRCQRKFKANNQSHICVIKDIGELFIDKGDDLVLAFDAINTIVMEWQPNSVGASKHAIVYASKKAWLIIKPMKKELDVKFYHEEELESEVLKKVTLFGKKYAHHIRIKHENEVTPEVIELLKQGFDFSIS